MVSRSVLRENQAAPRVKVKPGPCSCGNKHYARGMCAYHYHRARRYGDFTPPVCIDCRSKGVDGSSKFCRSCGNVPGFLGLPRRLWFDIHVVSDVPQDSPCWIWTGSRSIGAGSPNWRTNGDTSVIKTIIKATGQSPPEFSVRSCGKTYCVNPNHTTPADDVRSLVDATRPVGGSGFRGVARRSGGWVAQARNRSHGMIRRGPFATPDEAHREYLRMVGEFEQRG